MKNLQIMYFVLSAFALGQVLSDCKTTSGLPCLTEKDPGAKIFFQHFKWNSPCFDFKGGKWCMYGLGNLKPCACTNGCCGGKKSVEEEKSSEESENQGELDNNQSTSGNEVDQSPDNSEEKKPSKGTCDSSMVKLFDGCTELKEKFCPLTSVKHGKTYKNTLCLYCGENKKACGGRICQYDILYQKDKDVIVEVHNSLRSRVALGKERQGVTGPQPPASNMMKLEWDDDLAKAAQMWALQCPNGHDKNRLTPEFSAPNIWVGQNIAFSWNSVKTMDRDYEGMIKGWYDEVKDFPSKNVENYSSKGATGVIGHYTAMVWATTTKVGCGFVMHFDKSQPRYPYKKILVCNYGKGGNILGKKMYKIGKPGSSCPKGHSKGLCLIK